MGMKEGTWYDEHWVLYATDESVDTTSETNTICWLIEFKQKKKQQD